MQGVAPLFSTVSLKINSTSSYSIPTEISADDLTDNQLIDMPAPNSINHLQWKLSNLMERRKLLKESKGSNEARQLNDSVSLRLMNILWRSIGHFMLALWLSMADHPTAVRSYLV
jgi:hypothetical protein